MIRVQKRDGSFHYSYNPTSDRFSTTSYNILRHAGAVISLFDLYNFTRDGKYLESARKGLEFLNTRFRKATNSASYVLDDDGKAKLGANGLALIALVEDLQLQPNRRRLEAASSLAQTIIQLQRPDGSLQSYYRIRGDEPSGDVSLYYPGEAILALVRLYRLNGDQRLLQTARRAADYYVKAQQTAGELPPDAWLIQALEKLFAITNDRSYSRHAIALADYMISQQYGSDDGEYEGGYGPGEPRATPAASRAEGILAAYRIARSINDESGSRFAAALYASARFQLKNQYTKSIADGAEAPAAAHGGFRDNAASPSIRIDYVQHNISSLLGIVRSLY